MVGVKERDSKKVKAKAIKNTQRDTLHDFIDDNVESDSPVNTADFKECENLNGCSRDNVRRSVGEYVREQVHIDGIESFWSKSKRAHKGTFQKISRKHLYRDANEFAVRHNIREEDAISQMEIIVAGMIGRRIMYKDLVSGEEGRMNLIDG